MGNFIITREMRRRINRDFARLVGNRQVEIIDEPQQPKIQCPVCIESLADFF